MALFTGTILLFDVASLLMPLTTTTPTRTAPPAGGALRHGTITFFDVAQLIAETSALAKTRNPYSVGYGGNVATGSMFAGGVVAPLARGATRLEFFPGTAYYGGFITQRLDTASFVNADVAPVLTIRRNGTIVANFLTCAHPPSVTGDYQMSGTIPTAYAQGDVITISVQATVNGVSGKAYVDSLLLGAPPTITGQIFP